MSFKQEDNAEAAGKICGRFLVGHAAVLGEVGRENGERGKGFQLLFVERKNVERVGIKDKRLGAEHSELLNKGVLRGDMRSYAGTDGHGIVGVGNDGRGEAVVVGIVLHDGFGDSDLQNVVVAAGTVDGNLSHTAAQASPCGKDGSPRHTVFSGNEEGVAEGAFVAVGRPWLQEGAQDVKRKRFHQVDIIR